MKTSLQPKLVAIVGGSGAGKTWLADYLHHALGSNVARLSLDDFYLDVGHLSPERRAKINFDHPFAIDWQLAETVLCDCRAGRVTNAPHYDFATHTRLPYRKPSPPKSLVLVDGLWLLWQPRISELFDLKIFLDCPAQLRFERRLTRDVAERGRTPDFVQEQFWQTVAPMHDRYVAPQARFADIILKQPPGDLELREVTEILQVEMLEMFANETLEAAENEVCLQPA